MASGVVSDACSMARRSSAIDAKRSSLGFASALMTMRPTSSGSEGTSVRGGSAAALSQMRRTVAGSFSARKGCLPVTS
ncbi:hypothetical protein [Sorangium cellulosum]|uniref:hypothetical protein n=1 Tax=Sorangium cellulosum TaxID=56 RepID=UPI001F48CA4C|nr:hypothetical protein [Sorangium cellulosum]